MYQLYYDITKLCWYQDVPRDQVLALQKALNKIPEFDTLTEDGVYGQKTSSSLEQILDGLTHGAFPSLTYINPLQTSITGIETTLKTTKSLSVNSQRWTWRSLRHTMIAQAKCKRAR